MGDQIGTSVSGILQYVPYNEFQRVLESNCPEVEKTALFAALCRINTLYMVARCGSGHLGSSFSSMEIMSYLHLIKLRVNKDDETAFASDLFFSSKGHDSPALYSILIGLGKLDFNLLHKLRRLGGLPGHPDVGTPNIVTNTGSLGMGVSKAKGMITANRLNKKKSNIYVLTGDGELQEGQFWESLISAANLKMQELTVIIDHNKLQSDTLVSKVSDLGDLPAKLQSFGWHVSRCNGNDLEQLSSVLADNDKVTDKPKVIIADTIKGRGVSFMEHTSIDSDVELYKFHSGAPSEDLYIQASQELIDNVNTLFIEQGLKIPQLEAVNRPPVILPDHSQRLVPSYTEALIHQAEKNSSIVALDADLILDTGLIPFQKKFPERFIECGIAEQDMVSQAGGMALHGMLPVVHSFACFLTARPSEQIYNNSTEHTKIIYVGTLAGVIPGGPGHSHQGVRDISAMSAMPGMTVVEPSCESEVSALLEWAVSKNNKSCYMRLTSLPVTTNFELPVEYTPQLGKGIQILSGQDHLIFAYGPQMLTNAVDAALELKKSRGLDIGVVNLPWLNNIEKSWLNGISKSTSNIFCIDNHYTIGGQCDRIASIISSNSSINVNVISIGLNEIPACGTNDEIMNFHKLDKRGIIESIEATLDNKSL
tara:strand:+ start:4859 stop:6811 length:1953 start_codon:yes stop_codon:yes gene_type:complete